MYTQDQLFLWQTQIQMTKYGAYELWYDTDKEEKNYIDTLVL